MNKDQRLLEEAYQSISRKDPKYFGKPEFKGYWMNYISLYHPEVTQDGSVCINGDFSYYGGSKDDASRDMDRLPFNFESVTRDFSITNCNNLKSLEGSPQFVPGSFVCDACGLTTLKGAPRKVTKYFECDDNNLTSLEGAPEYVGTNFWASANPFTSLEGAPEFIGGRFATDNFSHEDYEKFVRYRRLDKRVRAEITDFDLDVLNNF